MSLQWILDYFGGSRTVDTTDRKQGPTMRDPVFDRPVFCHNERLRRFLPYNTNPKDLFTPSASPRAHLRASSRPIRALGAKKVHGITDLMHVCNNNMVPMSALHETLLADPDSINKANSDGITALMYAARACDPAAVDILLRAGAQPQAKDCCGETAVTHALSWSANHSNINRVIRTLKLLLDTGRVSVHDKDGLGVTPLQKASGVGLHLLIRAFLRTYEAKSCLFVFVSADRASASRNLPIFRSFFGVRHMFDANLLRLVMSFIIEQE